MNLNVINVMLASTEYLSYTSSIGLNYPRIPVKLFRELE